MKALGNNSQTAVTKVWKKLAENNIISGKRVTPNCKSRDNSKSDNQRQNQPSTLTGTFSSVINTAALTTAQGEVKRKINTKNNMLMGLYWNPQGDYTKRGNAKKVQDIPKARGFVCAKGERGWGVEFLLHNRWRG